jgi:hypothetical protein
MLILVGSACCKTGLFSNNVGLAVEVICSPEPNRALKFVLRYQVPNSPQLVHSPITSAPFLYRFLVPTSTVFRPH